MGTMQLTLKISPQADEDAADLTRLTRQLRAELTELDVDSVEPLGDGQPQAHTKGLDLAAWGGLAIALAASGGVLTTLINTLQAWLTRHERRSVTLEIAGDKLQVTGLSSQEQSRLIETWVGRHTKSSGRR